MRQRVQLWIVVLIFLSLPGSRIAHATVFGELQGIVHDPEHRPITNAQVTLQAIDSQFVQTAQTNSDGYFSILTVPLGNYRLSITSNGFDTLQQSITVYSNSSPILHFQLQVGKVQ